MKGDIIRTNALTKKKCLNLYKCHRPEWLNNKKKKQTIIYKEMATTEF